MNELIAQQIILPGTNPTPIQGAIPTTSPGVYRFTTLGSIVGELLKYIFPIAGSLMFVFIIIAGFQWITSSGDPKKVESARNRMTYAILGFVLLIASYWLARIVQVILSPNQPFF